MPSFRHVRALSLFGDSPGRVVRLTIITDDDGEESADYLPHFRADAHVHILTTPASDSPSFTFYFTVSRASMHRFPWVENRFVREAGYGPFHGEILVVRNRTAGMGGARRFVNMRGSRRERVALRSAIGKFCYPPIIVVVSLSAAVTDGLYSYRAC